MTEIDATQLEFSWEVEAERHELVELAFSRNASIRLKNSLLVAQTRGILSGITLRAVAREEAWAINRLLSVSNLGEKTLRELKNILANTDLGNPFPNIETTRNGCNASTEEKSSPQVTDPLDAISYLAERERFVISKRLGLDGSEPLVLSEIGEQLSITRERVRQIESKALRQLHGILRSKMSIIRSQLEPELFEVFARHHVIHDADESDLLSKARPPMRLIARVEFGGVKKWLNAICKIVPGGWLLPDVLLEEYAKAEQWLTSRISEMYLPCQLPSSHKSGEPAIELLYAAAALSRSVKRSGCYLLPRGSTKRALRTVRTHHLMLKNDPRPMTLAELKETYRKRFADDSCSARDLSISLTENPHLFLNLYEIGWLALGEAQESSDPITKSSGGDAALQAEDAGVDIEGETARGTLVQILQEVGPQSFNELRRQFMQRTNGRYSKASVGPILISYDDFIRLGPGIYALRSQLESAQANRSVESLMVNKTQCEIYCRAMWAGEPHGIYSYWTPYVESKWAEWCEENNQEYLLVSLLAIAKIDRWPLNEGQRTRWKRIQDRMASYMLEELPLPLSERRPLYRHFLACAHVAVLQGGISWIGVNRVTGFRPDDRHSVSILALLVAANIVEAAPHWQHRHPTTEIAAQRLHHISLLTTTYEEEWTSEVVQDIVLETEAIVEFGWLKSDELKEYAASLESGKTSFVIEESEEKAVLRIKETLKDRLLIERVLNKQSPGIL